MTEDMDARARVKRLEAECERLRGWLSRIRDERKEEGACYGALAGAQKAFARQALEGKPLPPPPESEPPTRDKPKWDPKRLSGNRMLRNPEDAARDVSNFAAPHTPEQAHRDALAALDRVREFVSDCEVGDTEPGTGKNEENREVEARLNDLDYIIRQALTASGVPYVTEEIRALPEKLRHRYKIGIPNDLGCAIAYELEKMIERAGGYALPYVPENRDE